MKIKTAHGQVAQTIYNCGGARQPEPFEFQLQADFVKKTGIKESNRDARAQLDWLMREHGFHLSDLRLAWKTGALRWCKNAGQWRSQHRWLDLAWGWASISILMMLLVATLALLVLHVPAGHVMLIAAAFSVAMYGGMAYLVTLTSLIPQRTAARVARAYLDGDCP